MSNEEVLFRLSQLTIDPAEVVFSITSRTILLAIVQRMGILLGLFAIAGYQPNIFWLAVIAGFSKMARDVYEIRNRSK